MPKPLAIALTVSHRKKPPVGLVPTEAELSSYQGKKPPVGLVPTEAEVCSYKGWTSLLSYIILPPSGRKNDIGGARGCSSRVLAPPA